MDERADKQSPQNKFTPSRAQAKEQMEECWENRKDSIGAYLLGRCLDCSFRDCGGAIEWFSAEWIFHDSAAVCAVPQLISKSYSSVVWSEESKNRY